MKYLIVGLILIAATSCATNVKCFKKQSKEVVVDTNVVNRAVKAAMDSLRVQGYIKD